MGRWFVFLRQIFSSQHPLAAFGNMTVPHPLPHQATFPTAPGNILSVQANFLRPGHNRQNWWVVAFWDICSRKKEVRYICD